MLFLIMGQRYQTISEPNPIPHRADSDPWARIGDEGIYVGDSNVGLPRFRKDDGTFFQTEAHHVQLI